MNNIKVKPMEILIIGCANMESRLWKTIELSISSRGII